MNKGIIYYTSHNVEEPIFSVVQEKIMESGLPVVSCSLKPIKFGKNIVLDLEPSVTTMTRQILTALEASESGAIFFCEHDVLYHPTHFKFTPPKGNVFYYNTNVWKWDYRSDKVVTYDHFRSVSGLCVGREKAIEHYKKKLELILEKGWDKIAGKNPSWARRMGYEPGKPQRIGGFSKDMIEEWKAEYPNIDIRHRRTLTPLKMTFESFRNKPTGWLESTIDKLPGWDLKNLFKLNG